MNILKYVLVAALVFTTSGFAKRVDVGEQMQIIAKNYQAALDANSVDKFKQALMVMREATLKSETGIPPKLVGKDLETQEDYRYGLVRLIEEIDRARLLAEAGKFKEAKKVAEQFKLLRNEYHQKYK